MTAREEWTLENQRSLAAGVARIRRRIEAKAQGTTPLDERVEIDGSALDRVSRLFALTAFERDTLLTAAAPELDGSFPAIPSFGLALSALADPHWSALLPQAPLRWWRLVSVTPGGGLTDARLRIEESVLHTLAGLICMDERVGAVVRAVPAPEGLPPSQAAASDWLTACWSRGGIGLQLSGPVSEAEVVAAHAAASLGLRLFALTTSALLGAPEDWIRLWQRDASMAPAALLIVHDGTDQPNAAYALASLMRDLRTPAVLASDASVELPGVAVTRLPVSRPTPDEQAALWQRALHPGNGSEPGPDMRVAIDRVVNHFDLGVSAVAAAALAACGAPNRLWAACRAQAKTALEHGLVDTSEPACRDDLTLPPMQVAMLREMTAQVRQRRAVQDRWGFAKRLRRGLGVSALFHGPSGTGKSLAAEVIASVLELDLHVIDLSRVVSKYIGDTERHLRAVFEAAEESGAVLLFDEADALFGRRSEVRDSHDRYANIEVSYLLQRMEQYRGLAVLTTNLKDAIDSAFLRRLRFIVEFPHPGAAERARIWQRVLPEDAPREGLDYARLAQANLTGGHIRNVALSAAYLAAEAGEPIRMKHVLHATRRECAKLERPLTPAEIVGWI